MTSCYCSKITRTFVQSVLKTMYMPRGSAIGYLTCVEIFFSARSTAASEKSMWRAFSNPLPTPSSRVVSNKSVSCGSCIVRKQDGP